MSFDLLEVDPWTGVRTLVDYDEMTDSLTVRREQDVGPILERNKALQTAGAPERFRDDDINWRLQASVPNIVQEKWYRDHGVAVWKANEDPDQMAAVIKLVNSSDWRWLKTVPGRV